MTQDPGAGARAEAVAQERRQRRSVAEKDLAHHGRSHRGAEAIGRVAAHFMNEIDRLLADVEKLVGRAIDFPAIQQARPGELFAALDRARAGRDVAQQFVVLSRGRLCSPDWIDLPGTLETLRPLLHHLTGETIRLALEPPPAPLAVHAPPEGLARVVTGLVADAAEALPVGGTIVIRSSLLGDATSVALTVHPVGFGQQPLPEPANHDEIVASWGGTVRLACDYEHHDLFYELILPASVEGGLG